VQQLPLRAESSCQNRPDIERRFCCAISRRLQQQRDRRRDRQPADDGDRDVVQVAEEHHRGLDDARHELRAKARFVQLIVGFSEPRLDVALTTEGLNDDMAGEAFLDKGVEPAGESPLGHEPFA
jgi:hypothetical protein